MKLILFFLAILVNIGCNSQGNEKKYDTLLFFNEFFVAPAIPIMHSGNGYGKYGFDVGFKHLFHENKRINFVYGLELGLSEYYIKHYNPNVSSYYTIYSNTEVRNLCVSNSFNWRFHLSESKRFYIEPGLFLDFSSKHLKGTLEDPSGPPREFTKNASSIFQTGVSYGFGCNFFFKSFEMSVKPDIKIHISPLFSQYGYYFQYAAYSRILFSFRFLK